jgi:hypothetical protein
MDFQKEWNKNIYFRNFCESLDCFGLTYEEVKNNYVYSGGDTFEEDINYYKMCFPNQSLPRKHSRCLCDHPIENNCYISKNFDPFTILNVGRCCIKRFKIESKRTCSKCKTPHRNRNCNRCNDCRVGICDGCDKIISSTYKKCWSCKMEKPEPITKPSLSKFGIIKK